MTYVEASPIPNILLNLCDYPQEWDISRAKHSDALDAVLDSLGSQLVPPEFYQTSADSSLFGSQPGSDNEQTHAGAKGLFSDPSVATNNTTTSKGPPSPISHMRSGNANGVATTTAQAKLSTSPVSPSATLKRSDPIRKLSADLNASLAAKGKGKSKVSGSQIRKEDRKYWKTLRDFVDDQSIDETLELIESDRVALEVCWSISRFDPSVLIQNSCFFQQNVLAKTDDYPEILTRTINSVQASLSTPEPDDPGSLKLVQDIIIAQEKLVRSMASVLENLASHYDNMATALKESENGEAFTEEELFGESSGCVFFVVGVARLTKECLVMKRDTEELPAIMSEMERDMKAIEGFQYVCYCFSA